MKFSIGAVSVKTAFDDFRKRLTSAPVLAYPDFKRQFILDTDASDSGIGAVLFHIDSSGQERVIAYGSRLLTKTERNEKRNYGRRPDTVRYAVLCHYAIRLHCCPAFTPRVLHFSARPAN